MSAPDRTIDLGWRDLFAEIRPVPTDAAVTVRVERAVIPIIFVPGIMGSRLKRMRPGPTPSSQALTIAWEPELLLGFKLRTARRLGWLVRNFVLADAESRKAQLIGTRFDEGYLEVVGRTPEGTVDEGDREHAGETADVPGAYERGWVGVSMESYGPILRHLSTLEWSEPVRHCFDLPVHAFGYNWSQSNITSGEQLVDYADRVVRLYAEAGRECEHVILVTHSMGGLVARAACQQLERDRPDLVLGVVHGVQPASGAPNAYWRMKGGFAEYVISQALGKNAAEVTPLLGNMPGGLQLLPNKRYRALYGGQESPFWFRYPEPTLDPDQTREVLRPETGDPYQEIYRERDKFYRLCDDRLLDPGGFLSLDPTQAGDPWSLYVSYIDEAETYHDLLQDYAHPDTVQFYSDGIETQATIEFEREQDEDWAEPSTGLRRVGERVVERVRHPIAGTYEDAANTRGFQVRVTWNGLPVDDAMAWQPDESWLDVAPGTYHEAVYVMTLQPPDDGLGDGTVPQTSGRALELGDGRTVRIGSEGDAGPGHEPAYKDSTAQHVTAMAIENLCLGVIRRETGGD
jgi:pimeloyl-ACP methyl ester carboxylesterase